MGEGNFAEKLISPYDGVDETRVYVPRALIRSVVYVVGCFFGVCGEFRCYIPRVSFIYTSPNKPKKQNERNTPSSCAFWRAIRREIGPAEFLRTLEKEDRCQESGCAAKIASEINGISYEFTIPITDLVLFGNFVRYASGAYTTY